MAGKLKPNIPKLGEEITLKDISYVNVTWNGKSFFGKGLFDELNSGNSEQNCAWAVEGDYLQFTTEKKINIWRQGSTYVDAPYHNPLKIYKKNADGIFIEITNTIEQIVTVLPNQIWEKTISNLEAGTYKFTGSGSGKTRIDGEWYVEKVNTTKYLISDKSSVLYTFNKNEIINSTSQILDDNNFKNNGFSDLSLLQTDKFKTKFPNKDDIKILVWTDDIERTEFKLNYECEPFDLLDWLKQNECKLLVYTDEAEKKDCNLVYNREPYKPIDKLNDEFDIVMLEE